MTGGTPEARSDKSLTLFNLIFKKWTNGPMVRFVKLNQNNYKYWDGNAVYKKWTWSKALFNLIFGIYTFIFHISHLLIFSISQHLEGRNLFPIHLAAIYLLWYLMHANDPTLIQLHRNGCSPSHQYAIKISAEIHSIKSEIFLSFRSWNLVCVWVNFKTSLRIVCKLGTTVIIVCM